MPTVWHRAFVLIWLTGRVAGEIALGALAGWTATGSEELVATIAAVLDYRKNWDAPLAARLGPPVIDIPGGVHENASTVSLRIGTTHLQPDVGLATALALMLGLDGAQPAVGLIGARASVVSAPIATLAAVRKVPQISFGSTSPALSNKAAYPYFMRTAPPDTLQAFALWEWIVQSDIPLVTCLYSTEDFGHGLVQEIQKRAQQEGQPDRVKSQALQYMPQVFDVDEVRKTLASLRQLGSHFVILAVEPRMASQILPVLKDEGMLGGNWQFVGTDLYDVAENALPVGFMTFLPSGRGSRFSDFLQLWSRIDVDDILSRDSIQAYSLDKLAEPLDHAAVASVIGDTSKTTTWAALCFDAVYTFLVAINQLLQQGLPETAIRGEVLLEALRKTQFSGVSGEVSFDGNGDRLGLYNLLNVQVVGLQQQTQSFVAAVFSASTGNFTFERQLVWMDGSRGFHAPARLSLCEPGNASFVMCSPGTFADGSGMSSCMPCAEGHFATDPGAFECSPCIPGFVAPRMGMEVCDRCHPGSHMPFVRGSTCFPCGGNQITRESGAIFKSECICGEGTFLCNQRCEPCPAGLYCPEGLGPPLQQAGFWADVNLFNHSPTCDASVLRCRSHYECPLGKLSTCADGREGPACNSCKPNHFPVSDGAETGVCQPCESTDFLPGLAFFTLLPCGLFVVTVLKMEPSQVSFNLLTAASVASQMMVAAQTLGSMRQLSLAWQHPVKRLLEFTNLLALDLDFVRITCIYGTDRPAVKFFSRLTFCPAACALILVTWLVARLCFRPKPIDTTLNQCGLFLFAFFLPVTLTTLSPFQCTPNPNGTASLLSDPGIVCYESDEHAFLVALAMVGLVTQPLPILVGAAYITFMYPSRVASGRGLRMMNRYRFLFHRFKPEQYYYGLFVLCRNGVVALLPIVTVDIPELQVPGMAFILLASLLLQVRTYPWRTEQANHVDLLLTSLLLMVLVGAAPLLNHDQERTYSVLGWLLCIPVLGLAVVGGLALLRTLLGHLNKKRLFGIFLCHHKGGAGSLCRLIKILVARHSQARVFLDCDQLENLDLLFDIVRTSTRSVVVVLTPEVLKRVWCAGEITTAWKNNITTVPLLCDGFRQMSAEDHKRIGNYWTPQQKQMLSSHGM
ncbi:Grm4, partial [Symbiodinium microadriaticum]